MSKIMKFVHYAGLVLFLGSICTYTLISVLTKDTSLESLAFARKIISTGTNYLTLPGLFLLILSGAINTFREYHFTRHPWLNIKQILMVIIVLNTIIFILPAETAAHNLAKMSMSQDKLLPQYLSAYMKESVFGAINVLLIISAMIIAISRDKGIRRLE